MKTLEVDFRNSWETVKNKDTLVTIRLTNTTLTRIGGFNARPYSYDLDIHEVPRSTQIKGLWRWWARVILNGVLWDKGYDANYGILDESISRFLGSTGMASLFRLNVRIKISDYFTLSMTPEELLEKFKEHQNRFRDSKPERKVLNRVYLHSKKTSLKIPYRTLEKIPRIRLLSIKRRDECPAKYFKRIYEEMVLYPKGALNIEISLSKNLSGWEKYFDAAFSSLLLALIFGGIGALTTRGFGALKIENVETKKRIEYIDLYGFRRYYNYKGRFEELLSNIISYARRSFKKIDIITNKIDVKRFQIPLVPALSLGSGVFKYSVDELGDIPRDNDIRVLQKIGEATLKARWKEYWKESGYKYDTWILGLPRGQKNTGYYYYSEKTRERKECRHISAIQFTPVLLGNKWYVLRYGFVTRDWRDCKALKGFELRHFGKHYIREGKPVRMDPLKAFKDAFEKTSEILRRR
ncbi:MAG: type III-B CRISPR module RAMP protein Cmr1 [Thermoprotei archaeon]|nr:MAG: type III-B CRISPR module RAMP protein Cmr1 [Thermoprotei archaeon]